MHIPTSEEVAHSPVRLLRQKLVFYLEDIETTIGRSINLSIAGLVLLSSGIFVAETYALPEMLRPVLAGVDQVILVIFAIEYGLRFWCADQKLKYVFSLYALLDLLAILPLFLGITDIRFIRIFRWFRILRLVRFIQGKTLLGYVSKEDSVIFARILFTLLAIIFVYSGLIYQVEHPVNARTFDTFFDAVYFSVVTMTTVGFGDVVPISSMGRLLTVMMILTGIALIPWQLGDLIRQLVKTSNQVSKVCHNCGHPLHDADAQFCKICGTELP